jgi:acyl carrier protein
MEARDDRMNVEQELQAIVGKKVKDHLEPGTKLVDAGLDSLDVMELAFDIEDRFKVQLPQVGAELISFTYGDLCNLVEKQLAAKTGDALAAPSGGIP